MKKKVVDIDLHMDFLYLLHRCLALIFDDLPLKLTEDGARCAPLPIKCGSAWKRGAA